jgi:hypothetical protein
MLKPRGLDFGLIRNREFVEGGHRTRDSGVDG